jgi:hypothetical protein
MFPFLLVLISRFLCSKIENEDEEEAQFPLVP